MKNRPCVLVLLLCTLLVSIAFAEERFTLEDGQYVVKGKNLPKFVCVRGFFDYAFSSFRAGEGNYKDFLKKLGMEPDTPASRIVTRAMFLAQALLTEEVDLGPYVNAEPAVYDAVNLSYLRNQVPRMKSIYDSMLKDMSAIGVPADAIEIFIDQTIRPSTIIISAPETPTKVLQIMDTFENTEAAKESK